MAVDFPLVTNPADGFSLVNSESAEDSPLFPLVTNADDGSASAIPAGGFGLFKFGQSPFGGGEVLPPRMTFPIVRSG